MYTEYKEIHEANNDDKIIRIYNPPCITPISERTAKNNLGYNILAKIK